jgi:hypothetical protein
MSRFEVAPCDLPGAASEYDAVAAALAQVLASLRAHGHPDTGRADTAGLLAGVLDGFGAGLQALGTSALADADGLRVAAAGYARTDAAAVRPR